MTRLATIALVIIGAAVLIFLVTVILLAGTRATGTAAQSGAIATVVDGDTVISNGKTYRLVGFDAPERGDMTRRSAPPSVYLAGNVELTEVRRSCVPGSAGTGSCNYGRVRASLKVRGNCFGVEREMELLLREIERALQARLYYLAVVTAVTIPDVCAALAAPDGESNRELYKVWYRANVGATLTWFTDVDCYKFRCGGVHQGRFGHRNMQYDRAIFLLPGPITIQQGISANNGGTNESAYMYSAVEFCRVFVDAARSWLRANESNATVQANMAHLVQLRPAGLAPHIVGVPVIA